MFLLDTHAFVWLASDLPKLSNLAAEKIEENVENLFISSITALEIALLVKKERLILSLSPDQFITLALEQYGIKEININREILLHSAALPDIHNDPFDRIIIATAQIKHLGLITKDATISKYPEILCVW